MNAAGIETQGVMCDECGRTVAKLQRRYHGHGYCVTCYAREFEKRPCPKCGAEARLRKDNAEAVCEKCEHAHKPCARCGKTDYRIGKITTYGPVCNACAVYFREPKPCANCGALSRRLARVKRLGFEDPVCPKCARIGYAACEACHKHRLLTKAADGRMLCKDCTRLGEIPCPSCGQPMAAGLGKRCQECYYRDLLKKRVLMDSAAIAVQPMANLFVQFGDWLGSAVGVHKAAITVHRYLEFFLELGGQWGGLPSYLDLLTHFGANGLRRFELPMRFLVEKGLVVVDPEARLDDSERRRVESVINGLVAGSQERKILEAYRLRLLEKVDTGVTTLRSLRLALVPAAGLLLYASGQGRMPPGQKELEGYLKQSPGQRAALSGFVNFLNQYYGPGIALPPMDGRASRLRRKKLEAELLALMQEGGEGEEFRRRWLSVALAYFHGLPRSVGRNIHDDNLLSEGYGIQVTLKEKIYWIPFPQLAGPERVFDGDTPGMRT